MAIFGIEGGIGTGKTLTAVHLALQDLGEGRRLFSNVRFQKIGTSAKKRVTYLNKEAIHRIFEAVKEGHLYMKDSTVLIQEMHNYLDSRNSMSEKNRALSYFILTSRHTSDESMDIVYDTQEFGQVDLRLRRNTDYKIRPQIVAWDVIGYDHRRGKPKKAPRLIQMNILTKVGHQYHELVKVIDVSKTRELYDTHEVVEW